LFEGLPEIQGKHICTFGLGFYLEPYNQIVEFDVAMFIFCKAEASQKIATGLACFDFSNFLELALEFERNYFKLQNVLLNAHETGQTIVKSEDAMYRYDIIIPDEPDDVVNVNSIRPKLTEHEIVRVRLHRIIIINLFQLMAFANNAEKFQFFMQDLKFELQCLQNLDQQVRLR
jgi:hypothetical protein